jgi:hypothetical protein
MTKPTSRQLTHLIISFIEFQASYLKIMLDVHNLYDVTKNERYWLNKTTWFFDHFVTICDIETYVCSTFSFRHETIKKTCCMVWVWTHQTIYLVTLMQNAQEKWKHHTWKKLLKWPPQKTPITWDWLFLEMLF